ncbi:MAG: hypothetical protein FWD38_11590 [Oscillospiraceae bacterium]|nr:hypothetical protein [Oscillospiraceae bacterium]
MIKSRFSIVTLFSVFILMFSIVACSNTAPPSDSNTDTNESTPLSTTEPDIIHEAPPSPPLVVQGDTLEEKLQNAVARIHHAGLSSGTVILEEEFENIHGEIIYRCHDDMFNYSINSNNFNVDLGTLRDWDALYTNDQEALEHSELTLIAHDLADTLFLYMDMTYTDITPYYDIDDIGSVRFSMYERRENCRVNIGMLELSRSGTIMFFTASSNSFSDFSNSNTFSIDKVSEFAFSTLLEIKTIVEASGGFDPGPEYGIIGLPLNDANYQGDLPEYEIYLHSIEDITFSQIEKGFFGDKILWFVEAQVRTSLGSFDSVFDYVWVFQFDAETGERVGYIEAISGS